MGIEGPGVLDASSSSRAGRGTRRVEQRGAHSLMTRVDALLFVYAGVAAGWLAVLVFEESLELSWQLVLLVLFWLLVAYLVLPRLHRVLTYVYVPGYFIGRTRTSDGLLGDPVNLALRGDEGQVHAAMRTAGWTPADDVTLASSLRIIGATVTRRRYPEAPVSPLFLFERKQDFAYQMEVHGNPAQRHHVRFWRCPEGWRLPGGYLVDWVAAGTYDRTVGLSLMTLQVTHRIAEDIDVERDHIVATLLDSNAGASAERIEDFAAGYHARNGGGDRMETDGDLPVVDLRGIEVPRTERWASTTDSRDTRPATIVFSAAVACLRGLVGLVLLWVLVQPGRAEAATNLSAGGVKAAAVAVAVVAAVDLGLGVATYLGRNWARVLLMLSTAVTILLAGLAVAHGGPSPTLRSGLPHVALGILVLLALTSPAARQYATRRSGGGGAR